MLLITIGCVLQENHAAIVYLSCPEMQIAVLEQNFLFSRPGGPGALGATPQRAQSTFIRSILTTHIQKNQFVN